MNDYFNRITQMIFHSPDDKPEGSIMKFGGVEVDLSAEPEVLAAKMAEAQKAYVASSDAGIKSAQALKTANADFEKFKKENLVPPSVGNKEMEALMTKMFDDKMAGITAVEAEGRKLNLNRVIEEEDKALRKEFSMLSDDEFKTAMKESNELWNKQESTTRTGGVYQTIAKLSLGKELQKNVIKVKDEVAYATMMNNPEQAKKFIEDYAKKAGIDINMNAAAGIVNQENFTTEYNKKTAAFKAEKDSNKRTRLAMEIADMRKAGGSMGYKYE